MTELYILIGFIMLCLTAISFLYFKYVFKVKPEIKPVPVLDFKKDYEFLKELMDFKIQQHLLFTILPMKSVKTAIIGDEEFEEILDVLVDDIWNSLSPSYKKIMNKYYTDEALLAHIVEYTMKSLVANIGKQNIQTLKTRNTLSVINNSRKSDLE